MSVTINFITKCLVMDNNVIVATSTKQSINFLIFYFILFYIFLKITHQFEKSSKISSSCRIIDTLIKTINSVLQLISS